MKFLVLQHLGVEATALIGSVIADAGHHIEIVRMDRGEAIPPLPAGYAGAIVMGGPMSANDTHLPSIADELALLKKAVATDFPVLGICLGAQLLAKAAGAEIVASPVRELGWYPVYGTEHAEHDPLFGSLHAQDLPVFQWHGETFTLPAQATLLATHPDVPNQAFRIGSSQYGLQFHIEVDAAVIEAWMEAGESERAELGAGGVAEIRASTPDCVPAAHRFCREMVSAWLGLCDRRVDPWAQGK